MKTIIGQQKKVRQNGKLVTFVWTACPKCLLERWVHQATIDSSKRRHKLVGLCLKCACPKGDKNPAWKGGRRISNDNYIMIYLYPTDPYFPMADSGHCVGGHRLLMARKLGRLLRKPELVHHLNGIRDDNRLENLAITDRNDHPSKTLMKKLQARIRELEQLHLLI